MPVIPPVNYSAIRNSLNTGDLLTFGGSAPLDFMIEFMEAGQPYSHVGMVLRNGTNLWFWDAPGEGQTFPDPYPGSPLQGQSHTGCRVANLDQLLAYYMSDMGTKSFTLRQLAANSISSDGAASLDLFIKMVDGTPFPSIAPPPFITAFLEKEFPGTLPLPIDLGTGLGVSYAIGALLKMEMPGTYFCAQLIADTYMHMGLLPYFPWPPNSYEPATFDSTDPTKLPLIAPAALSVAQTVNWDLPIPPTKV